MKKDFSEKAILMIASILLAAMVWYIVTKKQLNSNESIDDIELLEKGLK